MPMPDATSLQGLVFSIDRFVGEDGPGIRTTVFMKGCPLRCRWCHSPQSQGVPTPRLVFHNNRCIGCRTCVDTCPQEAQIVTTSQRSVLWERCDHCGECTKVCPPRGLQMAGEWLTVDQVISTVERDKVYYKNSGGGVTFSGGEPTLQSDFLLACLRRCQEAGIHTAIDTSGFVKWSVLEKLLPYIDLFLYDLKQMDDQLHQEWTGVSNERILENLKGLSLRDKPVWIRIPLIPGYNDSEENLQQVAELIKPLKNVRKVTLLPYNILAGAKYPLIGKTYELEHLDAHTKNGEQELVKTMARYGITAELGGCPKIK